MIFKDKICNSQIKIKNLSFLLKKSPHNFFREEEVLYSLEHVWCTRSDHGEKKVPQRVLPMSVSYHGCQGARAELSSDGNHLPPAPGSTSMNGTSAMGPLIFAIPSFLPESRIIKSF